MMFAGNGAEEKVEGERSKSDPDMALCIEERLRISIPSPQNPVVSPPMRGRSPPLLEHPGRRHLDAFHLIKVIGKGGFGTVSLSFRPGALIVKESCS
mmetsp:Transcript_43067/g.168583  ORF Transcript_43067/g.168583 Transcript_43067/m.168583 type:complete len:97 (+) Transcript_43067:409-699(+)